jgi:outer membrane protein assembly factor BamD (BamD/ComL family)
MLFAVAAAALLAGAGCASQDTQEDRSIESVKLYKQGVDEYRLGKIDAAIDDLRKAKDLQPDYSRLRYDLGLMLLRRADAIEAASYDVSQQAKDLRGAGKATDADAKDKDAVRIYQNSVYDARDALGELAWVESTNFPDKQVYYWLSQAHTHLLEFREARDCLERFMAEGQLGPDDRERLAKVRENLVRREVEQERAKTKGDIGR